MYIISHNTIFVFERCVFRRIRRPTWRLVSSQTRKQQSGCRYTLETAVLLYLEGLSTGAVGHRTVEQQVVELCGAVDLERTHGTSRQVQQGETGPETDSNHDSHCEQTNLPASLATHYSTLTPVGAWCTEWRNSDALNGRLQSAPFTVLAPAEGHSNIGWRRAVAYVPISCHQSSKAHWSVYVPPV